MDSMDGIGDFMLSEIHIRRHGISVLRDKSETCRNGRIVVTRNWLRMLIKIDITDPSDDGRLYSLLRQ